MSDCLTIFIIYKYPNDYPQGWVVKRWIIDSEGAQPDILSLQADTLARARQMIPEGLVRFSRNKDDDESVFESWL